MARVDLVVVHSGDYKGREPAALDLWSPLYPAGQVCTGLIRMAQRFIIELFTDKGSVRYFPERGCYFYRDILHMNVSAHTQLYSLFNRAVYDITPMLHSGEYEEDDPDEQFQSANLLDIVVDSTAVYLYIELVSEAENRVVVKIPVFNINEGDIPAWNLSFSS